MNNPEMTNEQAIEIIKSNWPDPRYKVLSDALTLAIKALKRTSKEFKRERKDND